jgi:C1A family cysteine protease
MNLGTFCPLEKNWHILTPLVITNIFFSASIRELKMLQSHHSFKAFMKEHNKEYKNKLEYDEKFAIFRENMKKVQFLSDTERGTAFYGTTKFADLTAEEFKKRHLGLNPKSFNAVQNDFNDDDDLPDADIPDVPLPKEFDWRDHGAVTPVKNQGNLYPRDRRAQRVEHLLCCSCYSKQVWFNNPLIKL